MEPANEVFFGELLIRLRKRKRLTQQELANLIGVHRSTISFWERSLYKPEAMTMLYELARVLDLDEEEKRHLFEVHSNTTSMVPLYTIPTEHNPYFTGREDVIGLLHQKLKADKNVALTQAISGLGGIGKTQVALEYTYRYREHYHHIFWASAETNETLVASYVEMARHLRLPEQEEHNQNKITEAVKRWLREHKNWLLVLDNIEDLSLIKRFLPIDRQGAVVLTTRRQVTEPVAQAIELDVLSEDDGALFLLRRIKRLELHEALGNASVEELAAAQAVTQQLDGLPLALDQAGAYILETGCTLAVYLSLWQQRQSELLWRRGSIPTEHPASVTMTFTLAFEWVQHKYQAAIELLKLCAFLAPDVIAEEIFAQRDGIPELLVPSVVTDPLVFNDAIEALRSLSLIRRQPGTHTLSIHRLVQAVVQQIMSESERQQRQQQAIHLLHTIFPEVTYETWDLCERLLPHVLTCATNLQDHTGNMELAALLSKAALYLHERAQYEQAKLLFEQALRIREQELGPDHPEVACVLNNLAELYRLQGKYEKAQPLFEQALHIREQGLGPDHPEVASILNKLAAISYEQGKYEQAQRLYERALRIREQGLEPEHPEVARVLNNLAMLYRHLGKYEKAQPLYERSLRIREQVWGPEHPNVAYPLNGLAILFYEQGKYEQAQPFYERALHIWEQAVGPEHPEVARVLNNLGLLSYEQGRYQEAQPFYERALRIWEQAMGPEHLEVAEALSNLANLYRLQGKYQEAQPFYERALHILEQGVGPEHPNVAYPLNGLAILFVEQGKYEQAERLYERALHNREQGLGPEHPETAQTLHDMATCFQKQDHLLQAVSLFERALLIRSQSLGDSHPKTVVSRTRYAQLVQELKYAEQERLSEQRTNKNQDSPRNEQSMMESASTSTLGTINPFASDNDPLATFLATCCDLHPCAWSRANELWQAYEHWVQEYQERFPLSRRAFTTHLKAHGCQADRTNIARIWRGIAIVNKEQEHDVTQRDAT